MIESVTAIENLNTTFPEY